MAQFASPQQTTYHFNQYAPQGAPQAAIQQWFASIDADKTGVITPDKLAKALSGLYTAQPEAKGDIDLETAKSLIQVFDTDRNGIISYHEFAGMHNYIMRLRQAFVTADRDRNGSISYYEVQAAFQQLGYQLSNPTAAALMRRFDREGKGQLDWGSFIRVGAYIAGLKTVFQWHYYQGLDKKHKKEKKDKSAEPKISLTFDQFVGLDPVFHVAEQQQVAPINAGQGQNAPLPGAPPPTGNLAGAPPPGGNPPQ